MNINTSQKNLSFQSRFEFVNSQEFNKIIQSKGAEEVSNLGIEALHKITQSPVYTLGIASSAAYGLTLEKLKAFLGHYTREAFGISDYLTEFVERGRAFIIGGHKFGKSEYAKEAVQEINKAKLPATIFWEQNSGYTNVAFDPIKDVCYILKTIEEGEGKKTFVDTIEKLREAFGVIHIAEGDELWINGKRITENINQGSFD